MKILLTDGSEIKAESLVGIVPARLRYIDESGVEREMLEKNVRQIVPAPTETLKEIT